MNVYLLYHGVGNKSTRQCHISAVFFLSNFYYFSIHGLLTCMGHQTLSGNKIHVKQQYILVKMKIRYLRVVFLSQWLGFHSKLPSSHSCPSLVLWRFINCFVFYTVSAICQSCKWPRKRAALRNIICILYQRKLVFHKESENILTGHYYCVYM